jgi:hypothetical protein
MSCIPTFLLWVGALDALLLVVMTAGGAWLLLRRTERSWAHGVRDGVRLALPPATEEDRRVHLTVPARHADGQRVQRGPHLVPVRRSMGGV